MKVETFIENDTETGIIYLTGLFGDNVKILAECNPHSEDFKNQFTNFLKLAHPKYDHLYDGNLITY